MDNYNIPDKYLKDLHIKYKGEETIFKLIYLPFCYTGERYVLLNIDSGFETQKTKLVYQYRNITTEWSNVDSGGASIVETASLSISNPVTENIWIRRYTGSNNTYKDTLWIKPGEATAFSRTHQMSMSDGKSGGTSYDDGNTITAYYENVSLYEIYINNDFAYSIKGSDIYVCYKEKNGKALTKSVSDQMSDIQELTVKPCNKFGIPITSVNQNIKIDDEDKDTTCMLNFYFDNKKYTYGLLDTSNISSTTSAADYNNHSLNIYPDSNTKKDEDKDDDKGDSTNEENIVKEEKKTLVPDCSNYLIQSGSYKVTNHHAYVPLSSVNADGTIKDICLDLGSTRGHYHSDTGTFDQIVLLAVRDSDGNIVGYAAFWADYAHGTLNGLSRYGNITSVTAMKGTDGTPIYIATLKDGSHQINYVDSSGNQNMVANGSYGFSLNGTSYAVVEIGGTAYYLNQSTGGLSSTDPRASS